MGDHEGVVVPILRRGDADPYEAVIDPTDPVIVRAVLAALPENIPVDYWVQVPGDRDDDPQFSYANDLWRWLREEAFPADNGSSVETSR